MELNKLMSEILTKYSSSIPNKDPDKEELIICFKEHFYDRHKGRIKRIEECTDVNLKKIYEDTIARTGTEIIDYDLDTKKKLFCFDSALEELKSLALDVSQKADQRRETNKITMNPSYKDDCEKELEEIFNKVREFNKTEAYEIRSELLLDLYYAMGINTDIMSLRMGRIVMAEETMKKNNK